MPLFTWAALTEAHDLRRTEAVENGLIEHRPIAAILGCSDARVSPTAIFSQPSGALFEVRVAGNTTGAAVTASLDYAVAHLGVPLVIVLGHTHCGAVQAALEQQQSLDALDDDFAPILQPICQLVHDDPTADASMIAQRNVARVVAELDDHFREHQHPVTVMGAVHHLESGRLQPIAPGSTTTHNSASR
jgi:carbonic anhydrase